MILPGDWQSFLGPALVPVDSAGGLEARAESGLQRVEFDRVFVFDLEMSGPNPRVHEVMDLGGVLVALLEGLPEQASFGARIRPRRIGNAEPGALRVIGYSASAWKAAVEFEPAARRFLDLGRGALAAGWGITQDMAFLAEMLRTLNEPWPFAPAVLDIQALARRTLSDSGRVERFNLGHVADRLGIGRMGEHGALADAYAAYDVLVRLVEGVAPTSGPSA